MYLLTFLLPADAICQPTLLKTSPASTVPVHSQRPLIHRKMCTCKHTHRASPFLLPTSYCGYLQGFMALPFLWETRVALDWTFTPETSLTLQMWFKLEDIYTGLCSVRHTC